MKIIPLLLILLSSQIALSQQTKVKGKDLKRVYTYMAGEFNSEAQANTDSTFYHVRLQMYPIWKERKDGYWLYIEQAIAEAEDKPYRQRVYHLFIEGDTSIVSKVYEIKNATVYTGGYKEPEKLIKLTADSLIDRRGCSIYPSKMEDGSFKGSTPGKECLSALRRATYATSEVTIYPDRVISWDRGWDDNDRQVWGAVKSGYTFLKTKNYKIK